MNLLTRSLLLLAAVLCSVAARADSPPAKMNILFLFADDWCRYAGAYAGLDGRPTPSDIVKTPNIDRLAHEGVIFRNAFVTAPSCTPCRSSLLSGQYFFRTGKGAILTGATWDANIPSFPHLLRDSGYHIGETYKVWSPGSPNDAPFGGGKNAYEKAGGAFNNFSENVTAKVKQGVAAEAAKLELLEQVKGNFSAFMADRKPGQPWLYWFGPTNVHRKWVKGSGKALWGIEPDSLKGKLPKFFPDVPEVREDVADYLGEIQAWDAAIGVILRSLEAAGELDRTIIVASGDHGAPGFPGGKCNLYDYGTNVALVARVPGRKGGRVVDDFVNLMDLAPTFCEIGGVKPPDVMTGRSLLPVLKSDKSGHVDPARTFVITGRERHVGHARAGNLPYPQRALRTKDFLYIRNFKPERMPLGDPGQATGDKMPSQADLENETYTAFSDMDAGPTKAFLVLNRLKPEYKWFFDYAFAARPAEELFDLKSDPEQIKNVAADPAYAKAKQELAEKLLATLKEVNDPRVTGGDNVPFENPPFTDLPAGGRRRPAQ